MAIDPLYQAIVVGGSYAGMAAAMYLARGRQRIAVIDAGIRRNRFAATSHGFLGQDGRAPGDIAADAKAQLLAYPSVTWLQGTATSAEVIDGTFQVSLEGGERLTARRLVLATGVIDELPAIPGLAERWGRSVFVCPYCHGYELNQGHIGVIGVGDLSLHQAMMLPDWGQVTLFTNETVALDDTQIVSLNARGVTIEPAPITAIVGESPIVQLGDGRAVPMDGLFIMSRTRMASPLAEQLGCAFDEGPFGPIIRTDELKQTTVPGVFACGDAARVAAAVALAVGDGTVAGTAAHRSLIFS